MLRPFRFWLVVSCVLTSLAVAAPKKKKPVPKPPANAALELELKKTLDGAEEKVGACVLDNAAPGAFTLTVRAKLNLNSAGQLLGSEVTLEPESESAEKTRKCIEVVLQGLTWPKSSSPMINAEREWQFQG